MPLHCLDGADQLASRASLAEKLILCGMLRQHRIPSMNDGIFIIFEFYLERLTKRSEQLSGGRGRRAGTGVYEWYMRIPSTDRARLAATQSFC